MDAKVRRLIENNFERLTFRKARLGKVTPGILDELDHYVRALWNVGVITGDEWTTYHKDSGEWLKAQYKKQQEMVKTNSYAVKIPEDALKLVLFALDMEIVKKDIARQDMEEKGDVWEVDRYTHEVNGLKSFKQLLDKLIEMQK